MFYGHCCWEKQRDIRGFTLIELLVAIAIIGVLASVVLSSLSDTRLEAKNVAALQQLRNITIGIQRMLNDTGKMPNGCRPNGVSNPEVGLSTNQAGLVERPIARDNGWNCEWTVGEVSRWNGPYVDIVPLDQFGRSYMYDPDYFPFRNCASETELPVIQAIVSRGADFVWYSCDDVYVQLK
jgi:prepilin-type N-terminal cleavage/methylation domain-containing protein